MKYVAYKLDFQVGVHFGKGMLNETRETFCADTLFSALCIEAVKNNCLDNLYQKTAEGKLLFSDGFPFVDDVLYIPKPMVRLEHEVDVSARKKWKNLKYIPLNALEAYLKGNLDVVAESERLSQLGEMQVQQKVSLTNAEKSEPFSVGIYHFRRGNGLYFIMGYESVEDKQMVELLIDSLGYQGIGGKTSSGLGKFSMLPIDITEDLVRRLDEENGQFVVLSTSLPKDSELEAVVEAAIYLLEKRGGFVQSSTYAEELVKKQEQYFLKAGSVVQRRFEGDVYNVGQRGSHPVWRYAKPILLEVSV